MFYNFGAWRDDYKEALNIYFSSPGLCPWRAYVATQLLASGDLSAFALAQYLGLKGLHSCLII